jgi:uncharacterized protein (DUF2147 family)
MFAKSSTRTFIAAKAETTNGELQRYRLMKRATTFLLGLSVAAVGATAASAADSLEGLWKNRPNTLVVRIAPCGQALCGTVVQASDDAKESTRKAGTANLVGTKVLTGLRRSSSGTYSGEVFNPNLNIHAGGTVILESPSVLVVRGCVLAGLICRQQHWIRVG